MEGVLTSSAGGRRQSEAGLGSSDLFRSLGPTGVIGDKDDEEVGTASKDMPANCRGSLLSPSWGNSAQGGGGRRMRESRLGARLVSAMPG